MIITGVKYLDGRRLSDLGEGLSSGEESIKNYGGQKGLPCSVSVSHRQF